MPPLESWPSYDSVLISIYMRFPMNRILIWMKEPLGENNFISTKRKLYFPSGICSNFFLDNFIFGETTSLYLFRVTTSTPQQLLFRSSYFFRAAIVFEELLFQNSRFFAAVVFFRIAAFSE